MNPFLWALLLAGIENFVLLNTVLSAAVFLMVVLGRVTGWLKTRHPLTQAQVYAGAIVFPTLVSGWLVLASLLPAGWMNRPDWVIHHEDPHTLHLLNALTFGVDPALEYFTFLFLVGTGLAVWLAAARAFVQIGMLVRCLEIGGDPVPSEQIEQVKETCRAYGMGVGLVYSGRPFSFVWGYLRSKLIVSTGLLNTLTEAELTALLEHEAAHHQRRDNLLKGVLTACRYTSPAFPLTNLIYGWWSHAVEMVCDEAAAGWTHPLDVAEALVKIKRLAGRPLGRAPIVHSAFFGENTQALEDRIRHLVGLLDLPKPTPRTQLLKSWTGTAWWLSAAGGILLLAVFAVAPLSIHRLLEQFLHRF
ncbi:MAG: M56 family metallopeptidase [Blastocatellia bacterium]|nr:M56 family metallopeptidase [Blastocatellia bacterium]